MMRHLTFQFLQPKNSDGTAATQATTLLPLKGKRPLRLKSGTGTGASNARFPLSSLKVFVSVGDGNIISGIHKGFKDFRRSAGSKSSPQIFGVQAEGSAAIANAFQKGSEEIIPVNAKTIADSISVDLPRMVFAQFAQFSKPADDMWLSATEKFFRQLSVLGKSGIFAEPAGAAAHAGLVKGYQR